MRDYSILAEGCGWQTRLQVNDQRIVRSFFGAVRVMVSMAAPRLRNIVEVMVTAGAIYNISSALPSKAVAIESGGVGVEAHTLLQSAHGTASAHLCHVIPKAIVKCCHGSIMLYIRCDFTVWVAKTMAMTVGL